MSRNEADDIIFVVSFISSSLGGISLKIDASVTLFLHISVYKLKSRYLNTTHLYNNTYQIHVHSKSKDWRAK